MKSVRTFLRSIRPIIQKVEGSRNFTSFDNAFKLRNNEDNKLHMGSFRPTFEQPRRFFSNGTVLRQSIIHQAAEVQNTNRMIEITWKTGKLSKFPFLWLRDNCQCDKCFHPVSLSRTFFLKDLDTEVHPKNVQLLNDGSELMIKWSDDHESNHTTEWLYERTFDDQQREKRLSMQRLQRLPWGKDLPVVLWKDILENDELLLRWLELLETYGLVIVEGAPEEPGHTRTLAERVAFVKRTHYGEIFSVIAKPDPSNVAYSTSALALHLDLPYYQYKPGVQLIHCVHQYDGEGGDSQVSDAVMVAKYLKDTDPEAFRLLSTIPIDWTDKASEDDREYFKMLMMPVICLENDGKTIWRINFSQPQRDSYFTSCPVHKVEDWYRAIKTYHDLLYDQKFCRTFKMKRGTLMTLDNLRVTHGRTGYPDSEHVRRHIEGCYVDWDEVRSRRRLLSLKYGATTFR